MYWVCLSLFSICTWQDGVIEYKRLSGFDVRAVTFGGPTEIWQNQALHHFCHCKRCILRILQRCICKEPLKRSHLLNSEGKTAHSWLSAWDSQGATVHLTTWPVSNYLVIDSPYGTCEKENGGTCTQRTQLWWGERVQRECSLRVYPDASLLQTAKSWLSPAIASSSRPACHSIRWWNSPGDQRKSHRGRKETQSIQVFLAGGSSSEFILENLEGRFLKVQAVVQGSQQEPSEEDPGEEPWLELDLLPKELEVLTVENHALKAEVSEVGRELWDKKSRFRYI